MQKIMGKTMWRNRIFADLNSFLGNPSFFLSFLRILFLPLKSWIFNKICLEVELLFSSGIIVFLEIEDWYLLPILSSKLLALLIFLFLYSPSFCWYSNSACYIGSYLVTSNIWWVQGILLTLFYSFLVLNMGVTSSAWFIHQSWNWESSESFRKQ